MTADRSDTSKLKELIWGTPNHPHPTAAATTTTPTSNHNHNAVESSSYSYLQQQQPLPVISNNSTTYSIYNHAITNNNNGNGNIHHQRNHSTSSTASFDYSHQEDPIHGTSNLFVATFNLVATIVGGGVLSLPFAFFKCGGALWGVLGMILAAIATDQSCLMLCWCARPSTITPSTIQLQQLQVLSSYGQVGKAAFGPIMEVTISALLFVFLVFVLIAYFVLVKDIWTPLIIGALAGSPTSSFDSGDTSSPSLSITNNNNNNSIEMKDLLEQRDLYWGPYVLMAIVLLMSPFLVQRTLHALRFNCYIGFASVSVLCFALCYHALFDDNPTTTLITANLMSNMAMDATTSDTSATTTITNVLWTRDFWLTSPHSIQDVMTAFPIIMLSFICHFNINPIQKALMKPTPTRVATVIHGSMVATGLLMTIFGVAGYAYVVGATNTVYGNILLNCEEQQQGIDIWLTLGRVGCGITIMLAMAIMMIPCRDSLLEVLDIIAFGHASDASSDSAAAAASVENSAWSIHTSSNINDSDILPQFSEETPLLDNTTTGTDKLSSSVGASSPCAAAVAVIQPPSLSENVLVHYATTFMIVMICYICAVNVPSVAIIWSLCGSSMAFAIAFMLPTACYLQMLHHHEQEREEERQKQQQQRQQQYLQQGNATVVPSLSPPQPKLFAWMLLVTSFIAAIVCTTQTIQSML